MEPTNSKVLFNYSKVLFEMADYVNSWKYLTRIPNKTWEVYDFLGDVQHKLRNLPMMLSYYKKAFQLSRIEEIKKV